MYGATIGCDGVTGRRVSGGNAELWLTDARWTRFIALNDGAMGSSAACQL